MGVKGILKFFMHRLIEFVLLVLVILFLPNLPPYSSFKDSFRLPPNKPFEGKLALNERLNNVEIWHKGDFVGPECFADYNGELYTSLFGGDVVKLTGAHISPIVKTGKPCRGAFEEKICGRPLGMQFDKQGTLYVADAYYGILKVNIKTGQKDVLVSPDLEINGKKPKVFNSLALASNGDIYWSDSSTQFVLQDGIFDLLSDPSGRLIHYDAKTKHNKVLIDKLAFANGVVLSENEDLVLVAETARQRIHRYYLKGPKKGTHDIFIDGLPGLTDNLSHDGQGGYFAPLVLGIDDEHPSIYKVLSPFPLIRKFLARVLALIELGFETIDRAFPNDCSKKAVHFIGHFQLAYLIPPAPTSTIIHLSNNGEILDSLHNRNNKISAISEVHIFKGDLYLGSPFNDYIARAPLADIGLGHLAKAGARKQADKPEVIKTVPKATPSPLKKETVPPPPKRHTTQPSPGKENTTPSPRKEGTTPIPRKESTTPTPRKESTTPLPPKVITTPPKVTTPPPQKQQTSPPKRDATTPPLKKESTMPPTPKKETTVAPPAKKITTTPPPPKTETIVSEPKVTTASSSPKQQSSSSGQHATTQKQTTPPPKQQNQPSQQKPPIQQSVPLKRESVPKKERNPPSPQNSEQAPPSKQQNPPVAKPVKEQIKPVPVKESIKTK